MGKEIDIDKMPVQLKVKDVCELGGTLMVLQVSSRPEHKPDYIRADLVDNLIMEVERDFDADDIHAAIQLIKGDDNG